jgi:hypothetical protein
MYPNRYFLFFFFSLVFFLPAKVLAQQQVERKRSSEKKEKFKDEARALLICFNYSAQFPLGILEKRYGFNNNIGFGVGYKLPQNFSIGLEGNFLFGDKVKENSILLPIATTTGQHITSDGTLNGISLAQRGFQVRAQVGKIVSLSNKNPNSGFYFQTGLGFIQHQIYINVREDKYPQLDKTYRKGYDRLTNGFCLTQMIGGIYLKQKHWLSLYGGFVVDIAFTKSRRNWDFDRAAPDNQNRVDVLIGAKVCWILPVFFKSNPEQEKEYFY